METKKQRNTTECIYCAGKLKQPFDILWHNDTKAFTGEWDCCQFKNVAHEQDLMYCMSSGTAETLQRLISKVHAVPSETAMN